LAKSRLTNLVGESSGVAGIEKAAFSALQAAMVDELLKIATEGMTEEELQKLAISLGGVAQMGKKLITGGGLMAGIVNPAQMGDVGTHMANAANMATKATQRIGGNVAAATTAVAPKPALSLARRLPQGPVRAALPAIPAVT
jgi:hypothetical protein